MSWSFPRLALLYLFHKILYYNYENSWQILHTQKLWQAHDCTEGSSIMSNKQCIWNLKDMHLLKYKVDKQFFTENIKDGHISQDQAFLFIPFWRNTCLSGECWHIYWRETTLLHLQWGLRCLSLHRPVSTFVALHTFGSPDFRVNVRVTVLVAAWQGPHGFLAYLQPGEFHSPEH